MSGINTRRTIKVLSPMASKFIKQAPISARIASLNGKNVGILWNGKSKGEILLTRILDALKAKYKLAGHLWEQKSKFNVIDVAMINELAAWSDVVIVGQGDSRSSVSWSIRNSIELERLNKPTATVCTDKFQSIADVMRKSNGMPELPLVIVSHPIGGIKKEDLISKADEIIEQIISSLTGIKTQK